MNIEDAEVQWGIPSSWTGCSESWDTVPANSHLRGETTKSSPLELVTLSLTTGQASLAEFKRLICEGRSWMSCSPANESIDSGKISGARFEVREQCTPEDGYRKGNIS